MRAFAALVLTTLLGCSAPDSDELFIDAGVGSNEYVVSETTTGIPPFTVKASCTDERDALVNGGCQAETDVMVLTATHTSYKGTPASWDCLVGVTDEHQGIVSVRAYAICRTP